MSFEAVHNILVAGPDFESCRNHVLQFFEKTQLLQYDNVTIDPDRSLQGTDPGFWLRIEEGLAAIQDLVKAQLEELKEAGCTSLDDLLHLEYGYPSKVLHIMTHLLDGFIGIDSVFYNLIEDSHDLSDTLQKKILQDLSLYWLLHVRGSAASPGTASFIHSD
ncbi:MAG: hypothetical protein KAK02_09225 [Desulfobulbaceae bacterium]|nr:hypothetical protein [Desulfobulbaceae bacterium]